MTDKIRLDMKDRRLLYELDQDARQSLSKLGKKIGLPKNVVAYRLKKLEEKKVIMSYYPIVDASKFGYNGVRIYILFQYITPEIEQEITNYFISTPEFWWCANCEGSTDFALILWVKNTEKFYNFWQQTLIKYGNYFKEQHVHIYVQLEHYFYEYLVGKKHKEIPPLTTGISSSVVKTDDLDLGILRELSSNAREPVTNIAKNLECTPIQVKHRIKRLTNQGVIKGFRVKLNLPLLNIIFVKVDLVLKDYAKQKQILEYVRLNPRLVYINKTIGFGDIEMEFHFDDISGIHETVNDLKKKFPGMIRYYTYFIVKQTYKENTVPLNMK